jgi:hypothetical protein
MCSDAAHVSEVDTWGGATTGYEDPGNKGMKYWDFPGGFTVEHPGRGYFEHHRLYAFDALVVNTNGAMKDLDLRIIELAAIYEIEVALVHNKSEEAVKRKSGGELAAIAEFWKEWTEHATGKLRLLVSSGMHERGERGWRVSHS